MKIKRIAIIGGGTSGWLAANHLGSALSADSTIEITLIESPDVPTIGVGEGTVPYIMKGLKRFGISEAELLLSCDATFKQGIKFVNWMDSTRHGENHYYHPFDEPYPAGFDVNAYWLAYESNRPFGDVGIQSRICDLGLAPKRKNSGEYEGMLAYAYHFDAAKFAELLARNAKQRFNVKYLSATIEGAKENVAGNISHLITTNGSELAFDFYVDCSGFSSILIDKQLNVAIESKADELLTDSVLVQQMPITSDEQLNPYTTATAHKAGWIWDIPLTSRRGTGFVYASKYMSDQEALELYAEYLGVEKTSISPRKIPMNVGYRERFWKKNCVALGLAQGFLEPIEATSILLSDFSAELLARNFPQEITDIEKLQPYYNKAVKYAWDRTVDFIKLHYCLSDRNDSEFWRDNRNESRYSEELKARLARFTISPPNQSDFFSQFDLFDEKNFLYVLYGMQFSTKKRAISSQEYAHCKHLFESNNALVEQASKQLLNHRDWLAGLKAAMQRSQR